MKRLFSLPFAVLFLISSANCQNMDHPAQNPSELDSTSSTDRMTQRIREDAARFEAYGPVPRFVQYDYAFAGDMNEYKKLNGYGILYIASLNPDSTEYPIVRVYFKSDSCLINLRQIGCMEIPVTDNLIKKIFGSHRIDYYYYFPYEMTQLTGSLLIDWKNNRKEFVLTNFPSDFKLDFVENSQLILPDDKCTIDDQSFDEFSEREFQIKLNR